MTPRVKTSEGVKDLTFGNWEMIAFYGEDPIILNTEAKMWLLNLKTTIGSFMFRKEIIDSETIASRKIVIEDLSTEEEIALAELDKEFPGWVEAPKEKI